MPLIDPGARAPDFSLPDQTGAARSLAEYAGKPVVLYFYPKDDTAGCTAEACQFRDAAPDFRGVGAAVLGVSPDDQRSHAKFARKFKLGFTLLSDVPAEGKPPAVCEAYGVWGEKSMYGRTYMGVIRTTYLIDTEGRVVRRWDAVRVPGHGDEVLAAVRALTGVEGAPPKKRSGAKSATRTTATKKTVTRSGSRKDTKRAAGAAAKKTRRR